MSGINRVDMMNRSIHKKEVGKLPIVLTIGLFVIIALFIRIVLPYHDIFVGNWIKFSGGDAYFYMRLVDNFVHNFIMSLRFRKPPI